MSDWRSRRSRKKLTVSASQIEAFRLCPRKWWMGRIRKLKEPQRTHFTFGTVLATALEKYLLADDLGYDESGQVVDMFAEGWTHAVNQFTGELDGTVNAAEADIIQRLVTKAIEEGVLERKPGRRPEHEFKFTLVELPCYLCGGSGWVYPLASDIAERCPQCESSGQGTVITIMGAIDVLYPEQVEDHKSTKSMRWAKSPKALAKNPQMLIYAKVALEEARQQGRPVPEQITLRHNVFCKDPNALRVRKTETTVTRKDIEKHWDSVIQDAQLMEHWRKVAEAWHDLPDPVTGGSACNAYGGCPYRSICSGRESEAGYETRLDMHLSAVDNARVPLTVSANNGESNMTTANFAQNIAAASGQPVPPAPVNPPVPQPAPMPVAAPVAAPPVPQPIAAPPMAPAPVATGPFPTPPVPMPVAAPVAAPVAVPVAAPPVPMPVPVPVPVAAPPVPMPVPMPVAAPVAAPWANPECVACVGYGFSTRGDPCPQCAAWAQQNEKPIPGAFTLRYPGDGTCGWTHKTIANYSGTSSLPGSPQVAVSESVALPSTPAAAPAPAAAAAPAPDKPKGRPAKAFILLVNSGPVRGSEGRGPRKVADLRQTLETVGGEIAASLGAASFYDLDPQQRKDMLAKSGEAIAESFGNSMVSVLGIGAEQTDIKALFDAVMPYAGMVIWGYGING